MNKQSYSAGDVFQINETYGRNGWIGAFVLADEIKDFGIQGYVHVIDSHDSYSQAFIRLNWDHIDYIGKAAIVPAGTVEA